MTGFMENDKKKCWFREFKNMKKENYPLEVTLDNNVVNEILEYLKHHVTGEIEMCRLVKMICSRYFYTVNKMPTFIPYFLYLHELRYINLRYIKQDEDSYDWYINYTNRNEG